MKSLYYQFVNYIQEIPAVWFIIIFLCGMSAVLMLMVKFYKKQDGTKTRVEKVSFFILAILLFSIIAFLTYLRN